MDYIDIRAVKVGDLFWECEAGQDGLFLALTNAHRCYHPQDRSMLRPHGIEVLAYDLQERKTQRFYEATQSGGYGPRLYTTPQYTRPNYAPLMAAIVEMYHAQQDAAKQEADTALGRARAERDEYLATATALARNLQAAEAEIARLRATIDDVCNIAARPQTGIELSERIRARIDADKPLLAA